MTNSQESEAALRAALKDAFPSQPITPAMLEEPTAAWHDYRGGDLVQEIEGRSWDELEPAFIELHHGALVYAGDAGFAALLPAYLGYLLDNRAFNEVPFAVAGVLKRYGGPVIEQIFDRRIARLAGTQRAVVKRVIEFLTTREPMEATMTEAFESYWRSLKA